ncbi:helix-turn-helix domain-containing protein [Natrinema hispanicum]|uniref:Predicted transcriptional regulator n=1 Tax=Natrinema hispanicum TaxID=392421 RepID=A0A1I0C8X3_9EURY|nr:helix-turn-helix domain-containing protein [Natrinema hispanicum]SDC52169.1 Predicted transcriptional regulator [Natrinema hispanicum]SET15840.1 Predicted transcriptional regulator [Natrinema hispanicum]
MTDSVSEYLDSELQCIDLLECVHGLKDLDRTVFRLLVTADEPLTVDDVADGISRDRSTAYRSISRLLDTGFVTQEQRNYESGGYYYVYQVREPDALAADMQRLLNDWYARMGILIQEFEDTFDSAPDDGRAPVQRDE